MPSTTCAVYLRSHHPIGSIPFRTHVIFPHGSRKTRPARTRIKLVCGAEERQPASRTDIPTVCVVIPILPRKRALRSLATHHIIPKFPQQLFPFPFTLLYRLNRIGKLQHILFHVIPIHSSHHFIRSMPDPPLLTRGDAKAQQHTQHGPRPGISKCMNLTHCTSLFARANTASNAK